MHTREVRCELCPGKATVYCGADEAFLCSQCDTSVHSANFLVARHIRSALCTRCGSPTHLQGTGSRLHLPSASCPRCERVSTWFVMGKRRLLHANGSTVKSRPCSPVSVLPDKIVQNVPNYEEESDIDESECESDSSTEYLRTTEALNSPNERIGNA